jgi:LEA14-like dessication related protein
MFAVHSRLAFRSRFAFRSYPIVARQLVAVALVISATVMSGCASLKQMIDVQKPTASVAGVSLGDLSLDQATLLVDVAIANPNPFTLDAAGFDLDLTIAGQQLASVAQPDAAVSVPAKGNNSIQLPVTLKFSEIAAAVGGLGSKNSVDYALDGNITMNLPVLGDISLPVSFADMLPIPPLPKISFSDVSLSDVSWSGAKLKVDLDVSNPNIFGLDLNTLAYNLEAEGKSLGSGSLEGVTLEKGQTQTLSIPMDVSLTNLGISLFRMLSGGEAVDIGLSGKADVAPDIGVWKPEPMTFEAKRTLNQK